MKPLALLLPCLTLAGAACQRVPDRTNTAPTVSSNARPDEPLRDTRWLLRQLNGQPVTAATGNPSPYLLISAAGTAEGLGGCNRFRAGLEPADTDGQLQLTALTSTRIACPALPAEQQFTQALEATRYYRVSGNTLQLYANAERQGTPLAQLEAAAPL